MLGVVIVRSVFTHKVKPSGGIAIGKDTKSTKRSAS